MTATTERDGLLTVDMQKQTAAEPESICPVCRGEGEIWTHGPDPQEAREVPCPECRPQHFDCLRCGDTGYIRNAWNNHKSPCPDCWQEQ